jgi:hypothetical protein
VDFVNFPPNGFQRLLQPLLLGLEHFQLIVRVQLLCNDWWIIVIAAAESPTGAEPSAISTS